MKKGDRVRIDYPWHEIHGRLGTLTDDEQVGGAYVCLDMPDSEGYEVVFLPADRLKIHQGRPS